MYHDDEVNQAIPSMLNEGEELSGSRDDVMLDVEEDEVLALKMQYVNNAIDEIGFTTYQLKLFFLNGFGYAVDSLLILLNALTQPQIAMQYQPGQLKSQTVSVGIGLLFGALFWGLGADVSIAQIHDDSFFLINFFCT